MQPKTIALIVDLFIVGGILWFLIQAIRGSKRD